MPTVVFPTSLLILVSSFLVLFGIRKLRERKWGYCTNTTKLDNKVAIVTGANSGIGYEITKELAQRNAKVILACRNLKLAQQAIARIEQESRSKKVNLEALELDLACLKSVQKFALEVTEKYPRIHILINNAGVAYPRKEVDHKTADGVEIHFGVNHLGHFYLTNLLIDTLKKSAPSRIIIVSSTLHEKGQLTFGEIPQQDSSKSNRSLSLYADSKLANVYHARELAKRLQGTGVTVYALCPGWVYTGLFRHSVKWYHYILVAPIAFFFMRGARQGAQTAISCATEESLSEESGFLYRDCKRYKSRKEFDDRLGVELWEKSEQLIRQKIA